MSHTLLLASTRMLLLLRSPCTATLEKELADRYHMTQNGIRLIFLEFWQDQIQESPRRS